MSGNLTSAATPTYIKKPHRQAQRVPALTVGFPDVSGGEAISQVSSVPIVLHLSYLFSDGHKNKLQFRSARCFKVTDFFWLMQVAVCITENIKVNHLKTCRIKERKYLYAKHFFPFFKTVFSCFVFTAIFFFQSSIQYRLICCVFIKD